MSDLTKLSGLRPCQASDDAFLYDVFCTTWESEVAALPNQNLAQHVLRIQHIAQERRLASHYPDFERFVVLDGDEPAGRLYLQQTPVRWHLLDLTLLPAFCNRGIGTALMNDLLAEATRADCLISLRVSRRHRRTTDFYVSLGFRLTAVNDLDNYFDWAPPGVERSTLPEANLHVARPGISGP